MAAFPGYIEVHASTVWNGRKFASRQLVSVEIWEDAEARAQLKEHLRHALGGLIAQQIGVTWQTFTYDSRWEVATSNED